MWRLFYTVRNVIGTLGAVLVEHFRSTSMYMCKVHVYTYVCKTIVHLVVRFGIKRVIIANSVGTTCSYWQCY